MDPSTQPPQNYQKNWWVFPIARVGTILSIMGIAFTLHCIKTSCTRNAQQPTPQKTGQTLEQKAKSGRVYSATPNDEFYNSKEYLQPKPEQAEELRKAGYEVLKY